MKTFTKSLKLISLGLIFNILYIVPMILSLPFLLISIFFRYFLGIYLSIKHRQKIRFIPGRDAVFSLNTNEMTIHGFLIIKGQSNLEEIRNRVKYTITEAKKPDGTFRYYRLRSTIRRTCGFLYWVLEDGFCLDDHVFENSRALPKNDDELYKLCTEISNEPLLLGKPPWQINVVHLDRDFLRSDSYVLLIRCHHTITDAVAALRLMGYCFFDNRFDPLMSPRSFLKIETKARRHSIFEISKSIFLTPYYVSKQLVQQDSNILHGRRLSGVSIYRMSTPVSLDRIKFIKAIADTSVNDVLLSCVGAALQNYFEVKRLIPPRNIHAVLAVAYHAEKEEPDLNNKCSSVTFKFKMNASSSLARLMHAHRQMASLKTKLFLPINLMCLSIVNLLPSCFIRIPMKLIGATFILSNVPGPQMPCFSNGNPVEYFGGFVPHINRTGIGITFFSFNGYVYFGMNVDKAIIPHVNVIDSFLNSCVREVETLEIEIQEQTQV